MIVWTSGGASSPALVIGRENFKRTFDTSKVSKDIEISRGICMAIRRRSSIGN